MGFGGTGRKCKGPCMKQCAWRKHGLCDMRLAEENWKKKQSRRGAPKVAILQAPCAQNEPGRSTMRPPEAMLPRNPTWESSHFSGLTKERAPHTPCYKKYLCNVFQTPPNYGFGRYGFGFFGPRIAFPATGALWGRATPFFYHFSVHLSSVLGRTELCHEVWTPGPQKPQIISNENHHLALFEFCSRKQSFGFYGKSW